MAYKSLKEKIKLALKNSESQNKKRIPLPFKILNNISSCISLEYICSFPPNFNPEHRKDSFILENVSGFYLEATYNKKSGEYNKNYYLNLGDTDIKERIKITVDDLDLFDSQKINKIWEKSFNEIKPGTAVIAAHPEVFLLKEFSKIFVGGFEHTDWDEILLEGTPVLALEKQKVEDFYFIKILYKAQIYWAFGALFLAEYYTGSKTPENHHFI